MTDNRRTYKWVLISGSKSIDTSKIGNCNSVLVVVSPPLFLPTLSFAQIVKYSSQELRISGLRDKSSVDSTRHTGAPHGDHKTPTPTPSPQLSRKMWSQKNRHTILKSSISLDKQERKVITQDILGDYIR